MKKHTINKQGWCKNCGMIAEDLGFDESCKKDNSPEEDTGTFADHLEEISRD